MAELKHRQQQEMEGQLQSHSHLPLMAQVLAPYWHQLYVCIFENSQLEGLYVSCGVDLNNASEEECVKPLGSPRGGGGRTRLLQGPHTAPVLRPALPVHPRGTRVPAGRQTCPLFRARGHFPASPSSDVSPRV